MSTVAQVADGVLQQTSTSATSLASNSASASSNLDKDDFLKLLVAQMQYQDPLEPTSNTEYISQFATFSELEQMQNVSTSMDMSRASTLVGKTVIMNVTASNGSTSTVMGKVDYVMYENNKAYLSINDNLYAAEDLNTVVDETYLAAYTLASDVATALSKLPGVGKLTLSNQADVEKVLASYDGMTDYQKEFLGKDVQKLLEEYRTKLADLKTAAEETE